MPYSVLRTAALLVLLLAIPSLWSVSKLQVDNRQEKLVNQSGEAARIYREFRQDFGEDAFVIVALSGRDLFDEATLEDMLILAESFEAIDRVSNVDGIPILYRDLFGEEDPEALAEELTNTSFYTNLFLSEDGEVAGLMLRLRELPSVEARGVLVEELESVALVAKEMGFRIDMVGQPIFSVAINRLTAHETSRTFPIAGIAALIILLTLLRCWRATFVVLLGGGYTLLLTLAVVQLLGWKLNLITTSLPLVLFVLSIANGIHIASRYQRSLLDIPDRRAAMQKTQAELATSCALSSLTTALGFLSLLVAKLDGIVQMGVYMSLGILLSLLVNFTLSAWLLIVFKVRPAEGAGGRLGSWLKHRVAFSMRHPAKLVALFLLLGMLGVWSIGKIESSGDGLQFLPKGHPLTDSYAFVSERLTGLTAVELTIDAPGGWTDQEYWPTLETLTEEIDAIPSVRRVYSPLTILKKTHQWSLGGDPDDYRLPEDREAAERLLRLLNDDSEGQLSAYTSSDAERIRVSVLANLEEGETPTSLIRDVQSLTDRLPAPLLARVTGFAEQMKAIAEGMLTTQLTSYGLAFVLIFTAMAAGLRSRSLLLMSVLPNLMPMLVMFSLMAWLLIPLNTATVMVASISLGIAVDNTVHFLNRYRQQRMVGDAPVAAAEATVLLVGPGITISTITACIGFYALIPSAFSPISHLGLLSGSAVLAALVANLLFLPATIALSARSAANA
ncbi:MAG: MMPL family transporter [Pseudomonadota bacterium]